MRKTTRKHRYFKFACFSCIRLQTHPFLTPSSPWRFSFSPRRMQRESEYHFAMIQRYQQSWQNSHCPAAIDCPATRRVADLPFAFFILCYELFAFLFAMSFLPISLLSAYSYELRAVSYELTAMSFELFCLVSMTFFAISLQL